MAAWSVFYPDVLVYVPGCPDPLLDQALRDAAIEFFQRTRTWVQWLEPVIATASLRQYELDLPTGAEVVRIEQATRNGRPLEVQGFRSLPSDPTLSTGQDMAVVSADRVEIVLTQAAATRDRIQVFASLMPTRTATTLPDQLVAEYRHAISEGAKHRLLRIPGPLSKPKAAKEAQELFEAAVASTSVAAWRSHTNVTPRATPRWC